MATYSEQMPRIADQYFVEFGKADNHNPARHMQLSFDFTLDLEEWEAA